MYGYHNRLLIVIARRYDEAIPKIQVGFAQLLCKSGIASYLAMTDKRFACKIHIDNQQLAIMSLRSTKQSLSYTDRICKLLCKLAIAS